MSNEHRSNLWDDGLKLVSYCPVCETRYNPMEARMLGEDGDTHLLHIRCHKCTNQVLALVLVNQVGVSSIGVITDLSFDDVMRFKSADKITVDDVIKTHTCFENTNWFEGFIDKSTKTKLNARAGIKKRKPVVKRKTKIEPK